MSKAILVLRDKPDASESEMQLYYTKLMNMKEGIYIGQNTTILFCFCDHVYFVKSLCTMTTVTQMEGFETGRPLYSTIDRYF
jgi:hypothetical protein